MTNIIIDLILFPFFSSGRRSKNNPLATPALICIRSCRMKNDDSHMQREKIICGEYFFIAYNFNPIPSKAYINKNKYLPSLGDKNLAIEHIM